MRILLAPDKFKGTLTAAEVVEVMRSALLRADPGCLVSGVAMADGGDGTLAVALANGYERHEGAAVDALGRDVQAPYATRGSLALIELAAVCGMAGVLDRPLRPWQASTLGLGLLARQVAESGSRQIVIGLGGSASVDGGLGLVLGLGARVRDRLGMSVPPGLQGVRRAVRLDLRGIPDAVRAARWEFLVDVSNPLLGPIGAAAVFGPQKGLADGEIAVADASLASWARLLNGRAGLELAREPGMGAAGGVAFAARALLDAHVTRGAKWIADQVQLRDRIKESDVVVTGEGSFDDQSLMGKAPGLVIALANEVGKPVYVVAGTCGLDLKQAREAGVAGVISLVEVAGSPSEAMHSPRQWLAKGADALLDQIKGHRRSC